MPAGKFEIFGPGFTQFEWDEAKRVSNMGKHGVDFIDILPAFNNPMARKRSDRNDEIRYLVIGDADGREIAVAYKEDGKLCRIVSARPARKDERAAYRALLARGN
jgi:uncharacterized DUF497 family protein